MSKKNLLIALFILLFIPIEGNEIQEGIVQVTDTSYTYKNVVEDLYAFKAKFPDFIKLKIEGYSNDLRMIVSARLGNGPKKIYIEGGNHGREYTWPFLMEYLEQFLIHASENKKMNGYDVNEYLKKYTLIFIPLVNPDGAAIARESKNAIQNTALRKKLIAMGGDWELWKANARGVDINRNFGNPYWGFHRTSNLEPFYSDVPAESYFGGNEPNSEPETMAVVNLLNNEEIDAVVTIHSRGRIIYYHMFGMPNSYNNLQERVARAIGRNAGLLAVDWDLEDDRGDGGTGTLMDHVTYEHHIPCLTIETMPPRIYFPIKNKYVINEWPRIQNMLFVYLDALESTGILEYDFKQD